MPNHDRDVLMYLALAELSQAKQQVAGRDKFLILAGVAACRSGWLDVAECCREIVLAGSPRNLLGRAETFADALRDADFAPFLKQLERFCSSEQAEHFLREWNLEVPNADDSSQEILHEDVVRRLQPHRWIAAAHPTGD